MPVCAQWCPATSSDSQIPVPEHPLSAAIASISTHALSIPTS